MTYPLAREAIVQVLPPQLQLALLAIRQHIQAHLQVVSTQWQVVHPWPQVNIAPQEQLVLQEASVLPAHRIPLIRSQLVGLAHQLELPHSALVS